MENNLSEHNTLGQFDSTKRELTQIISEFLERNLPSPYDSLTKEFDIPSIYPISKLPQQIKSFRRKLITNNTLSMKQWFELDKLSRGFTADHCSAYHRSISTSDISNDNAAVYLASITPRHMMLVIGEKVPSGKRPQHLFGVLSSGTFGDSKEYIPKRIHAACYNLRSPQTEKRCFPLLSCMNPEQYSILFGDIILYHYLKGEVENLTETLGIQASDMLFAIKKSHERTHLLKEHSALPTYNMLSNNSNTATYNTLNEAFRLNNRELMQAPEMLKGLRTVGIFNDPFRAVELNIRQKVENKAIDRTKRFMDSLFS